MKKIAFMLVVFGFGLICLQQKSYAEKKTNHAEYQEMAIKECNSCHKSEGVALNHDSDFVRGHRVLASKAGNNCSQCHEQKWCLDCHAGGGSGDDLTKENAGRDYKPKSHRSDFIAIHPIKALGNAQQCYRCHDAQAFCNSCHSRVPKSSSMSNGIVSHMGAQGAAHAAEARRNMQSCQACHADGATCLRCHSTGVSPHPRSWKSGNIKNKTNSKVCLKCHLPGTF